MTSGRYNGDNCSLVSKLFWFQMPAVLKISHCRLFFPHLWLLPDGRRLACQLPGGRRPRVGPLFTFLTDPKRRRNIVGAHVVAGFSPRSGFG